MAKTIAQRGVVMMEIPDAQDTFRVPQRGVFWSPFKGMNTTLPKNLLPIDTLQWAENVVGWYGSAMTRPGVRNVGGSTFGVGDTFDGTGLLSAHDSTGYSVVFGWTTGRYGVSTNSDGASRSEVLTVDDDSVVNERNDLVSTTIFGSNRIDISPTTADYTLYFDYTSPASGGPVGQDSGWVIRGGAGDQAGYVVSFDYSNAKRMNLSTVTAGGGFPGPDDSADIPGFVAGTTYRCFIRATGTLIESGYIDGSGVEVVLCSFTDSTYTTPGVISVYMNRFSAGAAVPANPVRFSNIEIEAAAWGVGSTDITTVIEFTTSDGISYLLRMGLFGVQYFDGTDWNTIPGYTAPSNMTVFDKFATTAFGDMLIFSDGLTGMYKYDPGAGGIELIVGAPSAKHLSTFNSRVVASYIIEESGLVHPTRIQWSVSRNSNDWTGIGSGFEDLLSTPGGFIDEQMGVYPIDDYKALAVRSNSIWSMTASGNVEAPFVFERRFPGLGSKQRHSITTVPGGIVGLMNDLSVYYVTDANFEPIGDPIRDARYSRNGSRLSRDADFGSLLAVGAYSGKQRKYVIVLSTRDEPVDADTGGFTSVMYQYDWTDKSWVRLAWPETALHWVSFSSGTKVGLTIDSSTGTFDAAGTESIDSEVGDVPIGQRDSLIAAGGRIVYREDYTLYHDETDEFGVDSIAQSLVSGQLTASTPVNRVDISGFRLIYMSSVTGTLTLRIHIWDSGAEETINIDLPIQKSMDSSDAVVQGSRMAYAPIRAQGYNIEFELINQLDGRVVVMGVAPEIKGTPDIVAGFGTTAMP